MKIFYRAQQAGISFGDMMDFVSADGGDGCGDEFGGVCATLSVTDLLNNTVMEAMEPTDDVIVFTGVKLCEIYDGVRVEPSFEIARYTVAEFKQRAYEIEEEMESR